MSISFDIPRGEKRARPESESDTIEPSQKLARKSQLVMTQISKKRERDSIDLSQGPEIKKQRQISKKRKGDDLESGQKRQRKISRKRPGDLLMQEGVKRPRLKGEVVFGILQDANSKINQCPKPKKSVRAVTMQRPINSTSDMYYILRKDRKRSCEGSIKIKQQETKRAKVESVDEELARLMAHMRFHQ